MAQQDMTALAADLEREYPETNRDVRFVLQELRENVAGAVREPLIILLATVAFVLLIACVNVANLLIAKGAARRNELAVRAAIGASRGRIVRQVLSESVLLAVAGGVCGIAVAWWLTRRSSHSLPTASRASRPPPSICRAGVCGRRLGAHRARLRHFPALTSASLSIAAARGPARAKHVAVTVFVRSCWSPKSHSRWCC